MTHHFRSLAWYCCDSRHFGWLIAVSIPCHASVWLIDTSCLVNAGVVPTARAHRVRKWLMRHSRRFWLSVIPVWICVWLLGRKGTCRLAIFSYTYCCVLPTCLDETNVRECAVQCWQLTYHASVSLIGTSCLVGARKKWLIVVSSVVRVRVYAWQLTLGRFTGKVCTDSQRAILVMTYIRLYCCFYF